MDVHRPLEAPNALPKVGDMRSLSDEMVAVASGSREVHHVGEVVVQPAELGVAQFLLQYLSIQPQCLHVVNVAVVVAYTAFIVVLVRMRGTNKPM